MVRVELIVLINNIQEVYDGYVWYGPTIVKKISQVDWTKVNTRFHPDGKSIADLVKHIINWRLFTLERLKGNDQFDIDIDGSKDWTEIHINNKEDWNELLEELDISQKEMVDLLKGKSDAFLSLPVPGRTFNYRFLINGICQHDIYHLGQIAQLNSLL